MSVSINRVSVVADMLGECPIWDAAQRRLYWVDGVSQLVRSYDPASGARCEWRTPSMIGSIGLTDGEALIACLVDGVHELDLVTGSTRPIFVPHPPDPRIRFNDGKADRHGGFVCGGMGVHADPLGTIYQIAPGGPVRALANGVRISNAICFSPDGGELYFADSLDRAIRVCAYDSESGAVGETRVLVDTVPYGSGPDGAAVDSDGCLWVALVQAGKIARFTPKGALDRMIDAPTDMPSCVAFGGSDLKTLFVTSIKDSGSGRAISRHAEGGHLYAIDGLGAQGLPEGRFRRCAAPYAKAS